MIITLTDIVEDEFGVGIGGVRVRAFPLNVDGTRAALHAYETSTAQETGRWTIIADTALSALGRFDIEIENLATEQVRWQDSAMQLQVAQMVGPHGTAPIPDGSVTDAKAGNRTVDDSLVPGVDAGPLTSLFSFIANRIKAITGGATWRSNPPTTLTAAAAHISSLANPHQITALQAGAVANSGSTPQIRTGVESQKGSSAPTGELFFATDSKMVYRREGGAWVPVATGDYNQLANKSHTHPGGDITSKVSTASTADVALTMNGQNAGRFPFIVGLDPGDVGAPGISTGPWLIQAGSEIVTTNSSGRATVLLPAGVDGFVTIIVTNGDEQGYPGHVKVSDSFSGPASVASFTIQISDAQARNVRVNWIVIHW